jgi:hypothetical protein
MTGPDNQDTRPISVAELLARHGTIGAPPVGGRRRLRRGNTDAVTVAELTGEIPIIRPEEEPAPEASAATNGTVEAVAEPEWEAHTELEPEVDEDVEERGAASTDTQVSAEEMLPDHIDITVDVDDEDAELAVADEDLDEIDQPPSYLHAVREPLFGGRFDEGLRRGDTQYYDDEVAHLPEAPPETTTAKDHEEGEPPPTRWKQIGRGALIVLQSILAVAFGAGLFIAFDELWKWNNVVALVLSVLVILGLVVGVRIVRKTEDIASTLIAVAVGALVTLGPLALLQSR